MQDLMLDEEYFLFLLGLLEKFLSNRGVGHENLIPRETTPFISTPRFREPRHSFDITSQGLEPSPLLSSFFSSSSSGILFRLSTRPTYSYVALTNVFFSLEEKKGKKRKERGKGYDLKGYERN